MDVRDQRVGFCSWRLLLRRKITMHEKHSGQAINEKLQKTNHKNEKSMEDIYFALKGLNLFFVKGASLLAQQRQIALNGKNVETHLPF